jgi:methionyl aminopeptidase
MAVELKTSREIKVMRKAGALVSRILDRVGELVKPGVSTLELDRIAEALVNEAGAEAAFKDYPHPHGGPAFPSVLCTSLNEEIVHGIPSDRVVLKEGDILSVDCGVKLNGFYGDSARTYAVGTVSAEAKKLLEVTNQALQVAIDLCSVGRRLNELSKSVQEFVETNGMSVVRDFVGHGVGRRLHEDPQVPNFCDGNPNRGLRFKAGMVIAIEPMVNIGGPGTDILDDQWTIVTDDRSLSAHFEHTVAITKDGPVVLTAYGC